MKMKRMNMVIHNVEAVVETTMLMSSGLGVIYVRDGIMANV